MKTYSYEELEPIAYFAHKGRPADVYLRDGIAVETLERDDGEGNATEVEMWSAEEVHLKTYMSEAEVAERFDELWVSAQASAKPVAERLDEMDAILGALIDVTLGE